MQAEQILTLLVFWECFDEIADVLNRVLGVNRSIDSHLAVLRGLGESLHGGLQESYIITPV